MFSPSAIFACTACKQTDVRFEVMWYFGHVIQFAIFQVKKHSFKCLSCETANFYRSTFKLWKCVFQITNFSIMQKKICFICMHFKTHINLRCCKLVLNSQTLIVKPPEFLKAVKKLVVYLPFLQLKQ